MKLVIFVLGINNIAMDYTLLKHLHLGFAVLFVVSYTTKSLLFLFGNRETFLQFKKKTIVIETIFSVIFLVFGFWMFAFRIKTGTYDHWVDSKISLSLLAIPIGIIGFIKENRTMVALSMLFFLIALLLGFKHFFQL